MSAVLLQFEHLPLAANLLLFLLAAAAVWVAGTKLSIYADEISDRKRIGKAIMGFVVLATATELPEIATTFTAAITDKAALVLNNMFGGITMQTAILAVADAFAVRGALTFYPRKPTPAVEATLIILLLTMVIALGTLGDVALLWNVGIGTIILAVAYVSSILLLRHYDRKSDWVPVEVPEIHTDDGERLFDRRVLESIRFSRLVWQFIIASGVILVCGVVLVSLTETIAEQSGLGSSFLGVTLLAATTSLPELSTTISAARIGAYTMAISNIFGSNLIMLALLFPADVLYRGGAILREMDTTASFALISGILVTAVYLVGLLIRRKRRIFGMGIDSALVLVLYGASLAVFYWLG